jgi:folate-binding protein YgfZ
MSSLDGYRAIRTLAAAVRRTDRGVLRVSGADRASWLQGLLTNDVEGLSPGDRRYSAYLTPQGRMITDLYVVSQPDRLLLDVPAPLAAGLRHRLDALIFAEDVQVADESNGIDVWGVYGPRAAAARGTHGVDDPSFGIPGAALYLDRLQPLPAEVAALPLADLEALDIVRIEAGTPKFLVDMNQDTIPLEAGIEDRAISFTKGCYVGQEVIVRVTTRGGGRVAKKLVRLALGGSRESGSGGPDAEAEGRASARIAGAKIVSGDREIGRVTSAAFSPDQDQVVALGYVHRDFTGAGTDVTVVWDDARANAKVI